MTQEELSFTLRDMGRSMGMCDKFYNKWVDGISLDAMLDMYAKGFDFCCQKDFPPLDFIRRNFDREDLHRHNIFIDEEVHLKGGNGSYFFLGKCSGDVEFGDFCISDVYLRHTSSLVVHSSSFARVFITLYEDSDCRAIAEDKFNLHIYDRRKKEGV